MSSYINGSLVGMNDAIYDKEYQAKLTEKTIAILGDKTSISSTELKKTPLFNKAYNKLDEKGKERFDEILNLDGDTKNVSEKELKTLLTILDADLGRDDFENREVFFMDGKVTTSKTGGIYQATDQEIQNVYKNTKTQAEQKTEEIQKMKEQAQQLDNINSKISEYKPDSGSDITKALNTIAEEAANENLEDIAVSKFFKGQIKQVNTYRDGGSKEYTLKDGTVIYHDNAIGGKEVGFVTITHPDGRKEKYNDKGELINNSAIKLNTTNNQNIDAEKLNQFKEQFETFSNINNQISQLDLGTKTGFSQAINLINKEGKGQLKEMLIHTNFQNKIKEANTIRDGGSKEFVLNDGTTIFFDNKFNGQENGFVTITYPDGTKEKYSPQGQKVQ